MFFGHVVGQAIANFVRNNLPDGPAFADIDAKLNSFQVNLLQLTVGPGIVRCFGFCCFSGRCRVLPQVDFVVDLHTLKRVDNYRAPSIKYTSLSYVRGQDLSQPAFDDVCTAPITEGTRP